MAFGDVLRGMASVLNPEVAKEAAQEDQQQRGLQSQAALMMFKDKLEQQSPEYKAKVQALQNEKSFREEVATAGGDVTKIAAAATKYGKPDLAVNLYNQQEARAARLQQSKDALDARRQELEMKISDKALDREQKDRFNEMMAGLKAQGLALQGEIAKGNQDLKKMQFTMQGDADLVKQTQKFGAALEKSNLTEADATLNAVEKILKDKPEMAEWISGPKRAVPDAIAGPEIAGARQAFDKLFNITLKLRSGAAVTQQELDRLKNEFGVGITKNPKQVENAVTQARDLITKHYKSVASGYGPKVLEAYNENMRGVGGTPVLDPSKVEELDPLGIRGK